MSARWLHLGLCLLALAAAVPGLTQPAAETSETAALAEAARLVGSQGVRQQVSRHAGVASKAIVESGEVFHATARSFQIELQGPMDNAQAPLAEIHGELGKAPWGGALTENWTPMWKPDAQHEGQPIPGHLWWYWSYPKHFAAARVSFPVAEGDVSLEQARAALRPVAEAVHRGVLAQGLDGDIVTAASGPYQVLIRIPPLQPGDVLSPGVDVLDAQGRPAEDVRGIAILIDGKFAQSLTWDGRRTVIEAQVSVAGQGLVAQRVIPAWGTAPPPPANAAPAALGPVGPLPPPRSLKESLVGMLAPPLAGLLGALAGLRGARAPRRPPPPTPKPKPRPKPGPKAAPQARDPARARAERTLDHLAQVARTTGDADLAQAVANARAQALGKDGRLDPAAWKDAQQALRAALGKLDQGIPQPTSVLGDSARAAGTAVKEFGLGIGKGLYGIGAGLFHLGANTWSGLKGIAHGLMNPRDFERGVREILKTFGREHLAAENKAFGEGLREGRYGDALKALAQGMLKTAGHALGSAWEWVRRDILPWDEIKSFFDPHASAEERLWALPAGVLKVAAIVTFLAKPTALPSTRWGTALHNALDRRAAAGLAQVSAQSAQQVGRLEQQLGALQKAGGKAPNASVQQMIVRTEKALEQARIAAQSAHKAHEVELLTRQAMRAREAFGNLQQAQHALKDNPALVQAIDDAIRANQGGNALRDLQVRGLISQDAHTLITARKLQLQDQAVNAASKRLIEHEVRALQAAGQPIPRRFDTFNATQGSRSRISGSNVQADLDQTLLGLKHVSREQAEAIIREECARVGGPGGMTQQQLDINIYRPGTGLMDARGAAPNAQVMLENIGQTTGTAGHHPVYVDRKGNIHVGDHVSTPQGREGVLAGRRTMDPPPGMTREQWLREGIWEGHQGAPVQIPREQWPAVRQTQLEGIHHAFERGDMNQMVKYANRGRCVGLTLDEPTARVVRAVAGQKDPHIAARMLREAGIRNPAELMQRLGLQH
ncbi:MAG: hypothetical protein JNL89_15085 [Rhodanobacteraceae bacterium]|nr:hypothetical protein [Rhodanobacteraceae bacterium]